jgi:hypothetical protein
VSGTATRVTLDLAKIGSGALAKIGRPPEDSRAGIALDIKKGGPWSDFLKAELALGQDPICFCGTPILDEAEAEKREGGGPIFDAVMWYKEKNNIAEGITA